MFKNPKKFMKRWEKFPMFDRKNDNRKYILDRAKLEGLFLEFGVATGASIRFIAKKIAPKTIYGFDTFTGIPESWKKSEAWTAEVGRWSIKELDLELELGLEIALELPHNVVLIKGLFQDVLPLFRKEHPEIVSFIHIDSDTYSAAKFVLEQLNDQIVPGTCILFDELCDFRGRYPLWARHEFRALKEWCGDYNREVEMVCWCDREPAAVKVVK